jgi:Tfp pilus assembly PilM family ATPase
MAHLVTGIDIGTASIKCVCIDAGFRRSRVVEAFEIPVAQSELPLHERQFAAVREAVSRINNESVFVSAIDGERLSIRELELPFTDPKKIDQVVPYELEGQMVMPLEEAVFDHMILSDDGGSARVLAAAARMDDVGLFLDRLTEVGISPRALYAAPLCYRREVVEPLPPITGMNEAGEEITQVEVIATPADVSVLLDVGHSRTNFSVLRDGLPIFARTLKRGGQQITEAIAAAFSVPLDQAEHAKQTRCVIQPGIRHTDATDARLAEIALSALAPLIREVRQSLASVRGRYRVEPSSLSVVGGSAALRGLAEAIGAELELPIRPFEALRGDSTDSAAERPGPQFALAEAITWSNALGTKQLDLRRGPFVYRASFSVIRQRAWRLGTLAALVLFSVGLDATMAYSKAHKERERLEADLEAATTELFGKPDSNAKNVTTLMNRGFREEMPPVPTSTAYDLLKEVSERLPTKEDIKLDVLEIEIRPRKTFMKGIIDSVASVDKVVDAFKEIDCFEEISKGAITEVAGGEKQFTLTIKSKCP